MSESSVQALFESMRSMRNMVRGMAAGLTGMLSLCQRASMRLSDVVEANGAPLKVLDDRGALVSEVLSVDTDKQLPANYYEVPAGMERVDMNQQINRSMQQMMENMPDINELMQQMQGSDGQMNEQMQQQMESLQKMLQQMQQQQ